MNILLHLYNDARGYVSTHGVEIYNQIDFIRNFLIGKHSAFGKFLILVIKELFLKPFISKIKKRIIGWFKKEEKEHKSVVIVVVVTKEQVSMTDGKQIY